MSRKSIEVLPDRWIVNARQSVITRVEALHEEALRLEFDTGLSLEVTGTWRATTGSPRTGSEVDLGSGSDWLGAHILSLVLFASGAIRLVLSDGTTIVARASGDTKITAANPLEFSWAADETGARHSLTQAEE